MKWWGEWGGGGSRGQVVEVKEEGRWDGGASHGVMWWGSRRGGGRRGQPQGEVVRVKEGGGGGGSHWVKR